MNTVSPVPSLTEFFVSKIDEALRIQKTSVSGEVHYYLVDLLTRFPAGQTCYVPKENQKDTDKRALALQLYDAVFDTPEKKFQHLKTLGDSALFKAGFFYDALYNQPVGVDYYINMGCGAYSSLANMTTQGPVTLSDLYSELSGRFAELVEILHLVGESEVAAHDGDLLRILERYQKTGSQKAKDLLQTNGIDPDNLTVIRREQ